MDRKTWHQRLDEVEASIARLADFDAEIRRAVIAEDRDELDRAYNRWSQERRACTRLIREAFEALEAAGGLVFPGEPWKTETIDTTATQPSPPLSPEIADAQRAMNAGMAGVQVLCGVAFIVLGLATMRFLASLF